MTDSHVNCPIATALAKKYTGRLRDVLGILWTLADINHLYENLPHSNGLKSIRYGIESPSQFARNPSFYTSELLWWVDNCSHDMGFWQDANGKSWSFAQLMMEISRRLEKMEDFETYLIAAAKFLKPEDAEITKSKTPTEGPRTVENQVESKSKVNQDNNNGMKVTG